MIKTLPELNQGCNRVLVNEVVLNMGMPYFDKRTCTKDNLCPQCKILKDQMEAFVRELKVIVDGTDDSPLHDIDLIENLYNKLEGGTNEKINN